MHALQNKLDVELRPETEADHAAIVELTRRAFWNVHRPGCDEHYLVHVLRGHPDCRADLNRVAEVGGRVAGHILYTRSRLVADDGAVLDTLTFGPLSVLPELQRRGIGKALMAHTIALAEADGCPAIVIFGNPANYVGSGFRGCKAYRVGIPGGRHPAALLVRALKPAALEGRAWTFHGSPAYELDPRAAEAFDARFPPLEKGWRPSQEEFEILSHSFVE
ncbi:MAG TPA: N-acetyltransferase [Anaeromyxobacter sp.]|nr:N-acetyltransferase [Anaeromyxobacter sp.]